VATLFDHAKMRIANSRIVESLSLNSLKCMPNGEPYKELLYKYSRRSDIRGDSCRFASDFTSMALKLKSYAPKSPKSIMFRCTALDYEKQTIMFRIYQFSE
jgi:hypothetical protein